MVRQRWQSLALALVAATILHLVLGITVPGAVGQAQTAAPSMTGLHVVGNQILNGDGQPLRLRGVNRTSGEYGCIFNFAIFEGPTNVENDEHPSSNVQVGERFVRKVVESLFRSPDWASSALFLT